MQDEIGDDDDVSVNLDEEDNKKHGMSEEELFEMLASKHRF